MKEIQPAVTDIFFSWARPYFKKGKKKESRLEAATCDGKKNLFFFVVRQKVELKRRRKELKKEKSWYYKRRGGCALVRLWLKLFDSFQTFSSPWRGAAKRIKKKIYIENRY
jgi:hypothetical protein